MTHRAGLRPHVVELLRHVLGVVLVAAVAPAALALATTGSAAATTLSGASGGRATSWPLVVAHLCLVALVAAAYVAPARLTGRSQAFVPHWSAVMVLTLWLLASLAVAHLAVLSRALSELPHSPRDPAITAHDVVIGASLLVPVVTIPSTMLICGAPSHRPARPLLDLGLHVGALVAVAALPLALVVALGA